MHQPVVYEDYTPGLFSVPWWWASLYLRPIQEEETLMSDYLHLALSLLLRPGWRTCRDCKRWRFCPRDRCKDCIAKIEEDCNG